MPPCRHADIDAATITLSSYAAFFIFADFRALMLMIRRATPLIILPLMPYYADAMPRVAFLRFSPLIIFAISPIRRLSLPFSPFSRPLIFDMLR